MRKLVLALGLVPACSFQADPVEQAEKLLETREAPGALDRAIDLLSTQQSERALITLAKARALLVDTLDLNKPGEAAPHKKHREAGKAAALQALSMNPQSGPAHYWLGLLLLFCSDGEQSYGLLHRALKELEAADRLSPDVDEAGPARMLGRIYQQTPGWPFLGSTSKSIEYLERAHTAAPDNLKNQLWLGLSYEMAGRTRRAKEQFLSVQDAKGHPDRALEEAALKREAATHLKSLGSK